MRGVVVFVLALVLAACDDGVSLFLEPTPADLRVATIVADTVPGAAVRVGIDANFDPGVDQDLTPREIVDPTLVVAGRPLDGRRSGRATGGRVYRLEFDLGGSAEVFTLTVDRAPAVEGLGPPGFGPVRWASIVRSGGYTLRLAPGEPLRAEVDPPPVSSSPVPEAVEVTAELESPVDHTTIRIQNRLEPDELVIPPELFPETEDGTFRLRLSYKQGLSRLPDPPYLLVPTLTTVLDWTVVMGE